MHSSIYFRKCVCVINSQQLKFNAVNGQSPTNQHGQRSNAEKSWAKFCSRSHDDRVYGSDTLIAHSFYSPNHTSP